MLSEVLKRVAQEAADFKSYEHSMFNPGDYVVVLTAGGKGQRISSVTRGDINKNALVIEALDESLIERTVKMYKNVGITQFVVLVYEKSQSLIDILGDGTELGVSIQYSEDPDMPVGKGGAVLHAYNQGLWEKGKSIIVHNPCDQIVGYDSFVSDMIASFEGQKREQGVWGSVVVAQGTPYTYSAMTVTNGLVDEISMYPQIPLPTHIGVSILSPMAVDLFPDFFSLTEKKDFEGVLLPYLAKNGKLGALDIKYEQWIAVKDPKSFSKLNEYFSEQQA
jgi:NDP-sugar pyrophosphorylase family protein